MAALAAVTVGMTEMNWRGISINPVTTGETAITLVGSDSGIICIYMLGPPPRYTLPACSLGAGKQFMFYCGVANNIVITSPTSATLFGPASIAVTCTITGAIGSCATVVGDGTYWYVISYYGTVTMS